MGLTIHGLSAFNDNYIWIIANLDQSTFICVDPGDAMPVLSYAKSHNLTLNGILLTHHHHDHIGGVAKLLDIFPDAIVYAPNDLRIPFSNIAIKMSQSVFIGGCSFRVLITPGHTRSHICYYEPHLKWLFCGDTLFSAGCGRVFDGTMSALHDSLLRLKNLPDDTNVYCGHEYTRQNLRFAMTIEPNNLTISSYYTKLAHATNPLSLPSTIEQEKKINPFLRTNTIPLQEYAQTQGIDPLDSFAIFQHLRDQKDRFQ